MLSNGDLIIKNLHTKGKMKIESVEDTLESELIYPIIRGSDIQRWAVRPKIYMLLISA